MGFLDIMKRHLFTHIIHTYLLLLQGGETHVPFLKMSLLGIYLLVGVGIYLL